MTAHCTERKEPMSRSISTCIAAQSLLITRNMLVALHFLLIFFSFCLPLTWAVQPSAQYSCETTLLAVRPTLSRQMDMESLMCAQIWVRAVHTKWGGGGGGGTNKSAQELIQRDQKNCSSTCPTGASDPGSSD